MAENIKRNSLFGKLGALLALFLAVPLPDLAADGKIGPPEDGPACEMSPEMRRLKTLARGGDMEERGALPMADVEGPAGGREHEPAVYELQARAHGASASRLGAYGHTAPILLGTPTLSRARVYPVPWTRGFEGRFETTALSFADLPAQATIDIYTVAGERVVRLQADGSGKASWDGNNERGRAAVSGTYLAILKAGGEKLKKRIVIKR